MFGVTGLCYEMEKYLSAGMAGFSGSSVDMVSLCKA